MRYNLLFIGALAIAWTSVSAQTPDTLSPDQKGYIVYHQCIMHAAIEASRSDAADDAIFGLARAQCADTRRSVTRGQETNVTYLAALDAADADKAANFPAWIHGVRERRRAFDAGSPAPR